MHMYLTMHRMITVIQYDEQGEKQAKHNTFSYLQVVHGIYSLD